MPNIKIQQTSTVNGCCIEKSFELNNYSCLDDNLIKYLFSAGKYTEEIRVTSDWPLHGLSKEAVQTVVHEEGVKEETVVVYDNAGIPSIMRKFSRVTDAELFGGADKPHPAFVIGGEVYDEIYISVYPNTEINGKPYSLPYQKPWTNITNDEATKACFSKGDGWHLMTAAEWGLIANISLKNGTLPHGNTNQGSFHADTSEHGECYDGCCTLTGSGPATWTHNHQPDGVHDLCGNVSEMVRGMRLKRGRLEIAKNNDAALDIDLTEAGDAWCTVADDKGKPVRISMNEDGDIAITSEPESEDTEYGYNGKPWSFVEMECTSEQLKELALFAGEPGTYLWADIEKDERFPARGGCWCNGMDAGVFCTYFSNARSFTIESRGFRSAYFKKH